MENFLLKCILNEKGLEGFENFHPFYAHFITFFLNNTFKGFLAFFLAYLKFCFTTKALIAKRSSVTPFLKEKRSSYMFWGMNLPINEIIFRKLRNIRLIIVKIFYFWGLRTWDIFPFHYYEYFLISPQSLIINISIMGLFFVSSWLVLFLS